MREALIRLNTSLSTATLEPFFEALDDAASKAGLMIKPVDKKREKVLLSENRNNLIHQLGETSDSALLLHLAVSLLFQEQTRSALHFGGKFVPNVIAFLKPNLDAETYDVLHASEQLVIQQLKMDKDASAADKSELEQKLAEISAKLKTIAVAKKSSKRDEE